MSVLILTYGAANKHKDLVEAVADNGVSPQQIVLVHNPDGSVDGARPWAPPGVSTLIMPRNVGYGHAMNAGIEFAVERGAEWLLLLTHDVQFTDSGLTTLLAARERGDGFAVLGPALRRADDGGVYSFGGMDDARTLVRHITDEPVDPVDGIAECLWIDGCAMLIRSTAVTAAGLMRGEFFMYFDEPEVCLRIRRLGWRVGVVTEAEARTSPGGFSRPAAYGYLFCRNGLAYSLAAGGRTGLLSGAISQLRLACRTLLMPRRDFYRPRHQLTSLSRVIGIGFGFVAFFAGRWGPPPPLLQRLGDMSGT